MEAPLDQEQGHVSNTTTPSLYEEGRRLLEASYLMFVLPDVRALIKENELEGDPDQLKRIIDLPCTGLDVASVYHNNSELIEQELVKSKERNDMYQNSIAKDQRDLEEIVVTAFEDEKSQEECVYVVGINHTLKRVTVAFRGSVTRKDFIQDAKAILGRIPNPIEDSQSLHQELAIHLGFKEYLYEEENLSSAVYLPNLKEDSNRDKEEGNPESEKKMKHAIIMEHVMDHFTEHPDYRLNVTGHSLGGALATLFAFEAAANPDIPKPVTCISSGAPKVGNLTFLRAFEQLEEQRALRCLRVANFRDVVTLSPPTGALDCCFAMCCQHRKFRHVGFRLKLTPHTAVISYPPKVTSYVGILVFDLYKKFLREEHTQLVYMKRFLNQKGFLSSVTLDDLYEKRFARKRWRIPVLQFGARMSAKRQDSK